MTLDVGGRVRSAWPARRTPASARSSDVPSAIWDKMRLAVAFSAPQHVRFEQGQHARSVGGRPRSSPEPGQPRAGVRELCAGTLSAYVAYIEMNGLYEVQAIDPAPGDKISVSISFGSGKYRFSTRRCGNPSRSGTPAAPSRSVREPAAARQRKSSPEYGLPAGPPSPTITRSPSAISASPTPGGSMVLSPGTVIGRQPGSPSTTAPGSPRTRRR